MALVVECILSIEWSYLGYIELQTSSWMKQS